jgi:hypothetical protein
MLFIVICSLASILYLLYIQANIHNNSSTVLIYTALELLLMYIQSVPGGKVNILGGHCIGHPKQEKEYISMCPIRNCF